MAVSIIRLIKWGFSYGPVRIWKNRAKIIAKLRIMLQQKNPQWVMDKHAEEIFHNLQSGKSGQE